MLDSLAMFLSTLKFRTEPGFSFNIEACPSLSSDTREDSFEDLSSQVAFGAELITKDLNDDLLKADKFI